MTEYTWLTAASQEFLERDYLDGQTVDERVDEICAAAERLLNKPGFAKAFKQVIQKGWCSLSTPIWTNFGNDRGLPISCVVGETWINTRYGGGKQASQIKVGDEVLTHRGRYRQVVDIMVTPSRCDIYEMKVVGRMTPLRLTGNHLVLTNLGWVRTDELNPNLHLVATNRVMEYSEKSHIIDLRPFCGYEFVEKDGRICKKGSSKVRLDRRKEIVSCYAMPFANVAVDDDLAWCIGLWFAEGSVATNNHQKPNGVKVTLNISERTVAERWLSLMQNKFGLKGTIYEGYAERNGKPNRWLNVVINSGVIGNFFASFGDGCKEKKMPDWMIDLSLSQSKCLLEGLMVGDGSLKDRDDVRVTLANPCLLLQVYYLGLKVGRTMSLQMQEKAGRLATTTHVYTVLFRQNKLGAAKANGKCGIPFSDGLTYAPIRSLWQTNRMETVYDFTVDEDHSFSAAGVVLHNCFGSYMLDDTEDIAFTHAEVMMMTKHGGGTSGYFGNLRGRGSKIRRNGESSGSVHFMQLFDLLINVVSQGRTRRGNFAAYQDIDHKDIMEFLALRSEGNPIQDLSYGVVVPDLWMKEMIVGDPDKRKVWAKVLECRANNGFPYIMFGDTVNNNTVDVYKDKNMRISHSNLCSEIMLPDSHDESFVCDLSSMNIFRYDEWKNTNAVELLAYFLDAVMTEFIQKASKIGFMERAVRFAQRHRALGIGWIGWHSYLQSKMIAFESLEAKQINVEVAKNIRDRAYAASAKMAEEYGEPEVLKGYGRRNTTLIAIAPTKSSAFILGQVSEGIEPHRANVIVKDLQKGKWTVKNPHLEQLLEEKGKNTDEVWLDILKQGGSVQHLKFLSEHEKNVFKTFMEISPKEIVVQAASRQKYIDQSQSLNLMIHPATPIKDVNALIIEAWKLGVKSLYYQISINAAQAFSRNIMACANCES